MDLVFKGGRYLKEILFLNSFSFENKDPRFTRLKPGLALRFLSKIQSFDNLMDSSLGVRYGVADIQGIDLI